MSFQQKLFIIGFIFFSTTSTRCFSMENNPELYQKKLDIKLSKACFCFKGEMINFQKIRNLLIKGANPNSRILANESLELNVSRDSNDSSQMCPLRDLLISISFNYDILEYDLNTVLEVIKLFITKGANLIDTYPIDLEDCEENSPLLIALELGNIEIIRLLVNAGGNPDIVRSFIPSIYNKLFRFLSINVSLTDYAKFNCKIEVFKELLKLGARNTLKRPGSLISKYIENLNQINWYNGKAHFSSCTEEFKNKGIILFLLFNKIKNSYNISIPRDVKFYICKLLAYTMADESLNSFVFSNENFQIEIEHDRKFLFDKIQQL